MISDPLMRMEGCRYRTKGAETNVYEPVYVETFDDDHRLVQSARLTARMRRCTRPSPVSILRAFGVR